MRGGNLNNWGGARTGCNNQGGPGSVRFGYRSGVERFGGSGFRFRRFLCKKGFSVFQYSLTGKDGSDSSFGS